MPSFVSDPFAQIFKFEIALAKSFLSYEPPEQKFPLLVVLRVSSHPPPLVLNSLIQHLSAIFRIRVVSLHIGPNNFAIGKQACALSLSFGKAQTAK